MQQVSFDDWVPEEPGRPLTIEERFKRFHAKNPHVYRELVALACRAKGRGKRRFGIEILFSGLRWEQFINTTGEGGFKLNDHFTSRYARRLMALERCSPGCEGCDGATCLAGLFELRELRSA